MLNNIRPITTVIFLFFFTILSDQAIPSSVITGPNVKNPDQSFLVLLQSILKNVHVNVDKVFKTYFGSNMDKGLSC